MPPTRALLTTPAYIVHMKKWMWRLGKGRADAVLKYRSTAVLAACTCPLTWLVRLCCCWLFNPFTNTEVQYKVVVFSRTNYTAGNRVCGWKGWPSWLEHRCRPQKGDESLIKRLSFTIAWARSSSTISLMLSWGKINSMNNVDISQSQERYYCRWTTISRQRVQTQPCLCFPDKLHGIDVGF